MRNTVHDSSGDRHHHSPERHARRRRCHRYRRKKLKTIDSPNGAFGPEPIDVRALRGGTYTLSQSGSFWIVKDYNGPPRYLFSERSGDLIAAFQSAKKLPIRFYIEIGRFDNGTAMLPMNRELRDILIAKGYDVVYKEFDSGHDYVWWRGSIADGLIALLGR